MLYFEVQEGPLREQRLKGRSMARGQALAEFALFAGLLVVLALILISFIPIHRARTTASTAAYACAQFLSQSRDPANAAREASNIANQIIRNRWSGSTNAVFTLTITPHSGPGTQGTCTVSYKVSTIFGGIIGDSATLSGRVTASSRAEVWRPLWAK